MRHSVVCVVGPSGWPCGTSLQDTASLSMIAVCGSTGPDTEPEPHKQRSWKPSVATRLQPATPNPEELTIRTTKGPQVHRIMQQSSGTRLQTAILSEPCQCD